MRRCDRPRQGKRIELRQMLLRDTLFQIGVDVMPAQSAPVETCLRGKHRELYYAHRDALKCQSRDCFGMGIDLALKDGPVFQCRDHLQARLLSQSVAPSDSLSRRSSSRTSVRSMCGGSSLNAPKTDAYRPSSSHTAQEPIDSSSSSGLSIPELVARIEDGGLVSIG